MRHDRSNSSSPGSWGRSTTWVSSKRGNRHERLDALSHCCRVLRSRRSPSRLLRASPSAFAIAWCRARRRMHVRTWNRRVRVAGFRSFKPGIRPPVPLPNASGHHCDVCVDLSEMRYGFAQEGAVTGDANSPRSIPDRLGATLCRHTFENTKSKERGRRVSRSLPVVFVAVAFSVGCSSFRLERCNIPRRSMA